EHDGAGVRVEALESVRGLYQGLHSFRNMRRMEASLRKASALRLRFSQSLASRRQRFNQAMVRSTIGDRRHRGDDNPALPGRSGRSLSELLAAGDIDALAAARHPRPHPDVVPLFTDAKAVERAFYEATHIF